MTQDRAVDCPHCRQRYGVSGADWPRSSGRAVRCDACGRRFIVRPARRRSSEEQEGEWSVSDLPGLPAPGADFPSGAAIASLLLGLGAFVIPVLLSIAAVVCGVIALRATRDGRVGGRGAAVLGIILGLTSLVRAPEFFRVIGLTHQQAARERCAENMKRIALAIRTYTQFDRNGAFPDSLNSLVLSEDVASSDFICPATSDTPAPGTTPGDRGASLEGGHLSYRYAGAHLRIASAGSSVVLYESLENHRDGSNMLFADGHVAFIPAETAKPMIEQISVPTGPGSAR